MAFFSAGSDSYKVPMSLHATNRTRLVERLRASGVKGTVFLRGAPSECRFDTDHELWTRQESYFQWLFGAKEPDLFGALEVETGRSTLFVPHLPAEYAVWMGRIRTPDDFRRDYEVDRVLFVDELLSSLSLCASPLLVLRGLNTDSQAWSEPARFVGDESLLRDETSLFAHIRELRVLKTPAELALLRHVARVSAAAHCRVMAAVRPGMSEYQAEALFRFHCHSDAGCRQQAYSCICACGPNAATLHYGHSAAPNDRTMLAGETVLFDMGAEYHCYCSDVTVCFPVSGRFSPSQAAVYRAVLASSRAVLAAMRPGVAWTAMHRLAERVLLEHLAAMGLVRGETSKMEQAGVGALFMPHGLGHLIGLDTHDVGGWPEEVLPRPLEPGISKLRCGRVLAESMVITVEPGCYFIDSLLEPAFVTHKEFLVEEKIRPFFGQGGVRIEDVVEVTANGATILSDGLPRTVEEIEGYMAENNPYVTVELKK